MLVYDSGNACYHCAGMTGCEDPASCSSDRGDRGQAESASPASRSLSIALVCPPCVALSPALSLCCRFVPPSAALCSCVESPERRERDGQTQTAASTKQPDEGMREPGGNTQHSQLDRRGMRQRRLGAVQTDSQRCGEQLRADSTLPSRTTSLSSATRATCIRRCFSAACLDSCALLPLSPARTGRFAG